MEWFSKNKYGLTVTAMFVLSVVFRFLSASQSVHPNGWDGYYYVMQVHSWLTYGHLQSPDFSLIYPFLAAIAFITQDFILSYHIGAALISGLLIISVCYALQQRNVPLEWIALLAAYLVFSPLITYFVLQFPKNALGLVLFVFFTSSLANLKPPLKLSQLSLPCVLFFATVLTHRMTGAFAIIATVVYSARFMSWKLIVVGLVCVIALGFLPGVIHISDLTRFEGQLTSQPQWAPLSFSNIFPRSMDIFFHADIYLIDALAVACLLLLIVNRRNASKETWLWFAVSIISLFPFFRFAPGDPGHRFFMIAPTALLLLLGSLVKFGQRTRWWPMVACLALILISGRSYQSYRTWSFDAPNHLYLPVVDHLSKQFDPEEYGLVIAHKSLAEIIIFRTEFDALNWLPPDNMRSQDVLRLTKGLRRANFRSYLDTVDLHLIKRMPSGYIAVREDVWQKFVQNASKANDKALMKAIYSNFNPMDKRPYFISKGRR